MSNQERTFIAVKPDGFQRGLVGEIVSRFEKRGYKLVAAKVTQPSQEHLEVHYQDLKDKPFFAGLIQYMRSGPIFAMVWEGLDVVSNFKNFIGVQLIILNGFRLNKDVSCLVLPILLHQLQVQSVVISVSKLAVISVTVPTLLNQLTAKLVTGSNPKNLLTTNKLPTIFFTSK